MTTICACTDGKTTVIGSDLLALNGRMKMQIPAKYRMWNDWAVGVAGAYMTIEIIDAHMEDLGPLLPQPFAFGQALRKLQIETYHYDIRNHDGNRGAPGGDDELLIAGPGVIYHVDAAYSSSPVRGFFAVGSGGHYALGAYDGICSVASRLSCQEIVVTALRAANRYDSGTGESFRTDVLPRAPEIMVLPSQKWAGGAGAS